MGGKLKIRVSRPWIGYSGTPVQQNYAEALDHGFLLWKIEDRNTFDVRFHALPNPRPYVTVDWSGSVERTLVECVRYPVGSRFRVRSKDVLAQKDVTTLTQALQHDLKATEVTFKSDGEVNRDALQAGAVSLAKADLRNPEVLVKLLQDYHKESEVTATEWDAVREQVKLYLQQVLTGDDVARSTKWTLRHLAFDNAFCFGTGNVINFEKLEGIVGVFGINRVGKSSIIGALMYALYNSTDRGSIKNRDVVNVRHPYCYTKAVINVSGTDYVIERQTVKHESRHGQVNANTHLNVFRIDGDEAVDLCGEDRKDTERVIRRLIGSGEDALLTSVAAQDDIKQYINQGSTKRQQTLSRFLDLDIFDRMYEQAKGDVNASKAALRNLPDRPWQELAQHAQARLDASTSLIEKRGHQLHEAQLTLDAARRELLAFRDVVLVTPGQVDDQRVRTAALRSQRGQLEKKLQALVTDVEAIEASMALATASLAEHDIDALKSRLDAYRQLDTTIQQLRHVHEKEQQQLKQQERSLKILDDVPCGDQFPSCKFIRDAHQNKDKVGPQRDKVQRAIERLTKAEASIEELKRENVGDLITKLERLQASVARSQVNVASKRLELAHVERALADASTDLARSERRLVELEDAFKDDENVEVVALKRTIDLAAGDIKRFDTEKLVAAGEVGRARSDLEKIDIDRTRRAELLQLMKAHELVLHGFSRHGIPNRIVSSQLPVINNEISQILHGIVDFNVDLEVDEASDATEVYIDYGDSRRPIELGSGMEKTIAALAIRVALINVSSLPKTDVFIIDEAFGPMDPASVEVCNRLLVSLKRYFKAIIVITHVEGVKDVADNVIEVMKSEKDSKVTYE